ncbi:MAG: hypothetical protein RBU21_04375 [FCB group bacterium]|nr:hypothetical protein [FCB group bacterium]
MPTPQTRTGGARGNASPKTSSAKPAANRKTSTSSARSAGTSTSAPKAKAKTAGAGAAKTSRSQSTRTTSTSTASRKSTAAKPQGKSQAGSQSKTQTGSQTKSKAGSQAKSQSKAQPKSQAGGQTKSRAKSSSSHAGASKASQQQSSGPMHDASAAIASYISGMKSNLKEWGIEIDTLKAKADKAGAGMRTEINRQIEMLHAKQQEASTRLQHLMEATGPAWRDLSRGIERAVRDLRTSLEKNAK